MGEIKLNNNNNNHVQNNKMKNDQKKLKNIEQLIIMNNELI